MDIKITFEIDFCNIYTKQQRETYRPDTRCVPPWPEPVLQYSESAGLFRELLDVVMPIGYEEAG